MRGQVWDHYFVKRTNPDGICWCWSLLLLLNGCGSLQGLQMPFRRGLIKSRWRKWTGTMLAFFNNPTQSNGIKGSSKGTQFGFANPALPPLPHGAGLALWAALPCFLEIIKVPKIHPFTCCVLSSSRSLYLLTYPLSFFLYLLRKVYENICANWLWLFCCLYMVLGLKLGSLSIPGNWSFTDLPSKVCLFLCKIPCCGGSLYTYHEENVLIRNL